MIKIKNIYYMLSYAFNILEFKEKEKSSFEEFENIWDLFGTLYIKEVSFLVKRGLYKEYKIKMNYSSFIKGKIDLNKTLKEKSKNNKKVISNERSFSLDTYYNRILKLTLKILLKGELKKEKKKKVKKLLNYFYFVKDIKIEDIDWNIKYNRSNLSYKGAFSLSYLILNGMIKNEEKGDIFLRSFIDTKRISYIYEKFILGYYKKEYPNLKVSSSKIKWDLEDDFDYMLPNMRSDITISYKEKILIIDAKFYKNITNFYYDTRKFNSSNLYQIFTYVKNKKGNVSGLLLYAKTDEDFDDITYNMSGNKISIKTLDLNCEFSKIKEKLDKIILEFIEN